MELLICGSGASEAIPALFCTCDVCKKAWELGGKDWRTRTAYRLGDDIQIDFGPDIMLHREKYRLRYENTRHFFISHPHKDHFSPLQLTYHLNKVEGPAILGDFTATLHGTREVIEQFNEVRIPDLGKMRLALDELEHDFGTRTLENGIKFSFIEANHFCKGALNYIVEMPDGFTFFIGTDSGLFREHTWQRLAGWKFDLMIIDGTAGLLNIEDGGHLTAKQVLYTVERLRKEKIAKPECRFITNHFAHCGGMLHEDLEKFYLPHGIEPAYDGMRVQLTRILHEGSRV